MNSGGTKASLLMNSGGTKASFTHELRWYQSFVYSWTRVVPKLRLLINCFYDEDWDEAPCRNLFGIGEWRRRCDCHPLAASCTPGIYRYRSSAVGHWWVEKPCNFLQRQVAPPAFTDRYRLLGIHDWISHCNSLCSGTEIYGSVLIAQSMQQSFSKMLSKVILDIMPQIEMWFHDRFRTSFQNRVQ